MTARTTRAAQPSASSIRVQIDHVVVRGSSLRPAQRAQLHAALSNELAAMLTADGIGHPAAGRTTLRRASAAVRLPGASAAALAHAVATAITSSVITR